MNLSLFNNLGSTPNEKKKTYQSFSLDIEGLNVMTRVYEEARNNTRVSITQNGIIIRIPKYIGHEKKRQSVAELLTWARNKILSNPRLIHKEKGRLYKTGGSIQIMEIDFKIELTEKPTKLAEAGIRRNEIMYTFPLGSSKTAQQKYIRKTLPKIICLEFLEDLKIWIDQLNQKHYQKIVKEVKMRNNKTSWGWCSRDGVINISPRLLLCPKWIIEYVLMHELAHLVFHDHSQNFWNLLASKYPETKAARKWLKQHGHQYDF